MVNCAVPLDLSRAVELLDRAVVLPISRNCAGSLSGDARRAPAACAAASANSPKRPCRLDAHGGARRCSTVISAAGTLQACAAACTSMARAVGAGLAHLLVGVGDRGRAAGALHAEQRNSCRASAFGGACSARICDQSASSSSATSVARPVNGPWPNSMCLMSTVTVSSAPMRTNALGANAACRRRRCSACAAPDCAERHGSATPMIRPPTPCEQRRGAMSARSMSRSWLSPPASLAASLIAARMRT